MLTLPYKSTCSITTLLYVAAIGLCPRTVNIQRCTHCEWGLMVIPSTLASFMLLPRSLLSCLPRAGVLMWVWSHVACCCCRAASSGGRGLRGESSSQHGCHEMAWVSNCSPPSRDCSAVLNLSIYWKHLLVWVTSAVSVPVSDRTLHVLIDHLQDLDLLTILTRMADRSEPYV